MKILFFVILSIYTIYLLISKKENRFLLVISVFMLGYVFAFNTDNNDYDAYLSFYEGLRNGSMEYINNSNSSPLFSYSILLSKYLGLDFNGYRLLLFGFGVVIISIILRKSVYGYFIAAYGLMAFFFDLVQIRLTFALFILLLGLYYLANGKKSIFLALIVISSLFHSMTIVFLTLVIIPLNDKTISFVSQKVYWVILIVFLATLVSAPIIGSMQQLVTVFSIFDEYSRYMKHETKYGYLLYFIYQTSNLIIAKYFYERFIIKVFGYEEQQRFLKFNLIFQAISMLFIFPAMLNVNFSRFIRISYMVNLLAFSCSGSLFSQKNIVRRDSNLWTILYLTLNGIWLLGESFANGAYANIINLVFDSL